MREYIAARRIVGSVPLSEALRFWQRNQEGPKPERTVAQVVDELVAGLATDGNTAGHVAEMKRALGKFSAAFQIAIGDVSTTDIDEYLRSLNGSLSTRNVYRRKIVTLFNYARRVGYLPDLETVATKLARAKTQEEEIEIYTVEEMQKLLENSTDQILPLIVLGGFCGLRHKEATRVEWTDLDFDQGTILITAAKAKTKTRRFAPLTDNAAAYLRPLVKKTGKVVTMVQTINGLRRLGERSGVEMKRNGLRHSFCSYRLSETNDANRTAMEAGHSVDILFKHYRQLCTKANAERWFALAPQLSE